MVRQESFQDSLQLLVLKILASHGPLQCYGMEEAGWIQAKWLTTDNKRRAGAYEITSDGRKQLNAEEQPWLAINTVVIRALNHA